MVNTCAGVPLEGFDQLVDKLVELYGELDEFNGEASEDEGAATTTGTTKSTKKSDDRNAATGDDDSEEEDYIDIDTEEVTSNNQQPISHLALTLTLPP